METKKGPINWRIESTGKLTFYGEVEVLKGGAGGTINIPKSIPEIGGKWGVKIKPLNFDWELAAQPRLGGGGLTGTFGLGGKWGATASCGSKRKGEISASLSGDGQFYPEFKLTDVSAELAGKFTFLFPRVPLLCQWTGCCHTGYCPYFQASIAPEISGTVGMEEGEPAMIAGLKFKNAELNIAVTVAGTVGAGSEGSIYYIAGTIGGKPYIILQFPPDSGNYCVNEYIKKVAFDLTAKFVVECAWWKVEEEWVFNIYTCPDTGQTYSMAMPAGKASRTLSLVQREYLNADEGYCVFPSPALPKGMMGAMAVGGLPDPITNVGTMPTPSIAATSDEGLLVFVYDDAGKPTGKHQEIYYARWNGSEWTTHAPLTDNMKPDSFPVAAIDASGNEIAVWMTAPEPNGSETGPRDILPGLEIAFSKYDTVGSSWSAPQEITSNVYVDMLPWFEDLPSGSLRICWIASPTNAVPVWHDEGIMPLLDVMAADWDGVTFGSPYVVAAGLQTVSPPAVCTTATHEFMAYSKDMDNNSGTAEDREVVVSVRQIGQPWDPNEQLTNDVEDISDTAVQLAMDDIGTPMAVWVKRMVPKTLPDPNDNTHVDQLWFSRWTGGSWSPATIAFENNGIVEPRLFANAAGRLTLFWVAVSTEFSDVYYSVYDSAVTQWGLPQQITHDQGVEAMISLAESGGNILAGYVKRRIDMSDPNLPPVIGLSDIYLLEHAPAKDLHILSDDISFDSDPVVRDSNSIITADVHLSGDFTVEDVLVQFYDGDPDGSGTLIGSDTIGMILPGQALLASVSWHVPDDDQSHDIYVLVDPNDTIPETDDVSNNRAFTNLFKPDLRAGNLTVLGYPTADTVIVGFSIHNDGHAVATGATCNVYRDDAPGETLFTATAGDINPEGITNMQFAWDVTGIASNNFTLLLVVDPNDDITELNENNNTSSGQVPVLYDLQVEPWSADVNDVIVKVTVRNVGAKPSAASTLRITREALTLAEDVLGPINPGDSVDMSVLLAESAPPGRITITANPDSDGSDEVTILNNSATVIVFAPADFEPDGDVDETDLEVMAGEWMGTVPPLISDIAPEIADGTVNLLDVARFAEFWMEDYN
ncbi:MAG: hypothetical protein KAR47_18375 [Planctomycetes bacterium]|nr:hypothetical protein [Planctomycetota bacterium]